MSWIAELLTEVLRLFNNIFIGPRKQVKKIITIYDTMHKLVEDTPVERFLIFKAHNGGGIIKPNTPIYSSVLYENYTYPFVSVKDQYQRLEADQEYLRLLADLITKKVVSLRFEDMREEGLLKSIYEAEGVTYSEIYFLGNDRKNIYYCSCGTSHPEGWINNPQVKNQIYLAVNKIKQNIK